MTFTALHRTAARTMLVTAPPEAVFPLLCPVREREWIPGWAADVLHSRSGVAELGCVFVTRPAPGRTATYVVTTYEPTRAIAFAIFQAGGAGAGGGDLAETLRIDLAPTDAGTELRWSRAYTGLAPSGNAWIEEHVPAAVEARLAALEEMLQSFVRR
jgi:carbon monoxide dehydrogenase subunit G